MNRPTPPDRADEQALRQAVELATGLTDDGAHPTDALKTASARLGLSPGRVALVAAALNVGHQQAVQEAGAGWAEKLAAVPPADPRAVAAQPPPPTGRDKTAAAGGLVKRAAARAVAAVDPRWAAPPPLPPAAVRMPPPPAPPPPKSADKYAAFEAEADRRAGELAAARGQARAAEAAARRAAAKVAQYFARPAAARLAGRTAELAAEAAGPGVRAVVKAAAAAAGAAEPHRPGPGVPAGAAEVLGLAAGVVRAVAEMDAAKGRADGLAADARAWAKTALLGQMPAAKAASVRSLVDRILPPAPAAPGDDPRVQEVLFGLTAPDHTDELRRARLRAMLHRFTTDPTDPISGHPVPDVLDAFNDLSRLAPQAADQPALAGPALRRALSGRAELFESKSLLDADKVLYDYRGYEDPTKPKPEDKK